MAETPDRIAIDADGYGWRVWDDQDFWSMVPTNPDNSPIPQPVTWFVNADQLTEKLLALHRPYDEEVECWADDENGPEEHDRRYPECPGTIDARGCEGHTHPFRTCRECGTVGSHDEVRFRPWPCATLVAVGYSEAGENGSRREVGATTADALNTFILAAFIAVMIVLAVVLA